MPVSKAQQKAVNKYVKENYDLYQVKMPKGRKKELQAQAQAAGKSLNAFINEAIEEKVAREKSSPGATSGPIEGRGE